MFTFVLHLLWLLFPFVFPLWYRPAAGVFCLYLYHKIVIMDYQSAEQFCIGNQHWRNLNPLVKMGRPRIYGEGEEEKMWTDAQSYFEYMDMNPLKITDWVGGMAKEIKRIKPLPYTIEGYCQHIGVTHQWFYAFKARKDLSPEFMAVIRAIEEVIYRQQYEGATVGLFQHNIIARKLGLAEVSKIEAEVKAETIDYSKLSDAALNEIIQAGNAEGSDSVGDTGEGGAM